MGFLDKTIAGLVPVVPRPVVRRVSSRYIAGESLDDAVNTVRDLNKRGMRATVDVLGEYIENLQQAEASIEQYIKLLDTIHRNSLDANVSVKLSSLGLLLDKEYCFQRVRELAKAAAERGNFLRIDMEDSSVTGITLDIHRKLREEYPHVGVAIQAYLRRTQDDVSELIKLGANIRLCKGIYLEPRKVAWKDPATINRNYARALYRLLERGCYTGIATHDERLIWEAERVIADLALDKSKYEFQMLLGVEEDLRDIIVKAGHPLRVYVPFGKHWFAYSKRRLNENPRIAGYILKAMFNGKG